MSQTVPAAVEETASSRRTVVILDLVFPRPRPFAVRLWDERVLRADWPGPEFTLTLRSPGSLRGMFQLPLELSLGEAYLRGDFDIDGDLVAAFALPHTIAWRSRSQAPRASCDSGAGFRGPTANPASRPDGPALSRSKSVKRPPDSSGQHGRDGGLSSRHEADEHDSAHHDSIT